MAAPPLLSGFPLKNNSSQAASLVSAGNVPAASGSILVLAVVSWHADDSGGSTPGTAGAVGITHDVAGLSLFSQIGSLVKAGTGPYGATEKGIKVFAATASSLSLQNTRHFTATFQDAASCWAQALDVLAWNGANLTPVITTRDVTTNATTQDIAISAQAESWIVGGVVNDSASNPSAISGTTLDSYYTTNSDAAWANQTAAVLRRTAATTSAGSVSIGITTASAAPYIAVAAEVQKALPVTGLQATVVSGEAGVSASFKKIAKVTAAVAAAAAVSASIANVNVARPVVSSVSGGAAVSAAVTKKIQRTTSIAAEAVVSASIAVPAPNQLTSIEWAAFGGTDPYSGKAKGVICRPGSDRIGYRINISRGDRIVFKVPLSQVGRFGTVQRATFFLTPRFLGRWDDSAASSAVVRETLFNLKRVDTALDLASCTSADALAATLSGAYGSVTTDPNGSGLVVRETWGCGGLGYDRATVGDPIDPWALDLTALANDAITRGVDLVFALECPAGVDAKTVAEFIGTEVDELRPRLELAPSAAATLSVTEIDTGHPLVNVTSLGAGTVVGLRWGYDKDIRDGAKESYEALPFRLPTMEGGTRAFVAVDVQYGADTLTFWRTFQTPKVATPLFRDAARSSLDVLEEREAVSVFPWSGDLGKFAWFRKTTTSGWRLYDMQVQRESVREPQEVAWGSPSPQQRAFTFDDVSPIWFDVATGLLYALSSTFNSGTGKYDIRLMEILHFQSGSSTSTTDWTASDGHWFYRYRDSGVIYSATAAPNLRLQGACRRLYDWRNAFEIEPYAPLVAAFYADGALRVFGYPNRQQSTDFWPQNYLSWVTDFSTKVDEVGPVGSGARIETGISLDAGGEVYWLSAMTYGRTDYSVLVARHTTGQCFVATRERDVMSWDGAAWARTAGAWHPATVANFRHAYVTNPALHDGKGHVPDNQTAFLALMRASAVELRKLDDLSLATTQPQGVPGWADTATGWLTPKWPDPKTAVLHTQHGGCVTLAITGTDGARTITAQRVWDGVKVSADATSAAVNATGTRLVAPRQVDEGVPAPVFFGTPGVAGSWGRVLLGAHIDVSRLDLPTPDLAWWVSSGNLTTANFDTSFATNAKLRGLKKLPGHNCFVAGFEWDPAVANGIMDAAGWTLFRLAGAKGESLKLTMHAAPMGKYVWVDGVLRQATGYYTGASELVGGMEFPIALRDNWFWREPGGKWHRILETEWQWDSETLGGSIVLTLPTLPVDTIEVCSNPKYDHADFRADIATWKAEHPTLVHQTNDAGDLCFTGGSPVSQMADPHIPTRKLTTWHAGATGNLTGTGARNTNFAGFVLEANPTDSTARAQKSLIIVEAMDDPAEQSAGQVFRGIVKELLSGSSLASSLLRKHAFLFLLPSQSAIEDGLQRYNQDNFRDGAGLPYYEPPPTAGDGGGWGYPGSSVGDTVTAEAAKAWVAERVAALGGTDDGAGVFTALTLHADTHSTSERLNVGVWPTNAPYMEVPAAWDLTDFKAKFDALVWPEFFAPQGSIIHGGLPLDGDTNALLTATGGKSWYCEMPWRAPSHKASFAWDTDATENMGAALLAGINVASGAIDLLPPTSVAANAAVSTSFRKVIQRSTAVSGECGGAASLAKIALLPAAVRADVAVSASIAGAHAMTSAVAADAEVATSLRVVGRLVDLTPSEVVAEAVVSGYFGRLFRVTTAVRADAPVSSSLATARAMAVSIAAAARVSATLVNPDAPTRAPFVLVRARPVAYGVATRPLPFGVRRSS